MRISREDAQLRYDIRTARLARLIELDAPDCVIAKERQLIADAVYAMETGEVRVRPED